MSRRADLVSTPALRAAARLCESLPVRTHTQALPHEGSGGARQMPPHSVRGAVKRKAPLGDGGVAKPVRIGKTVYPSVTVAARTRRRSTRDIYQWLRDGVTREGLPCHFVSESSKETP